MLLKNMYMTGNEVSRRQWAFLHSQSFTIRLSACIGMMTQCEERPVLGGSTDFAACARWGLR